MSALAEWQRRIAGGWTPCTCVRRHRGACSSPTHVQPEDEPRLFDPDGAVNQ
jgi:hypothetical protein